MASLLSLKRMRQLLIISLFLMQGCTLVGESPCVLNSDCALGQECADNGLCRAARNALCGNGELEQGEQCDDGNVSDGDGCDARCFRELGVDSTKVVHTF